MMTFKLLYLKIHLWHQTVLLRFILLLILKLVKFYFISFIPVSYQI